MRNDYRKLIAGLRAEGMPYDAKINEYGDIVVTYNYGTTVSIFGTDCMHIKTINIEE